MPTPLWKLGADVAVVGSRFFFGDDANQNQKLPAYWLLNLHGSYQLTKEVQLYVLLNNVLDKRHALFGTYFKWTNDRPFAEAMMPHVERALRWIDEYGDVDGDGFLEYERHSPRGLDNQGPGRSPGRCCARPCARWRGIR